MNGVVVLPTAADDVAFHVPEREYRRLLRLPAKSPLPAEMRELADGARRWYATHGRPFVATRRVGVRTIGSITVSLESGIVLTSEALAASLRSGQAQALMVVAASAGPEVADEAARLWVADRPDEAYFLDRLAAAITEDLLVRVSSGTHHSPGCGHWDLADQRRLMGLLDDCVPIALLDTGALRPQHSVLAAFGVTSRASATAAVASPCRSCDLDPCGFRRTPFKHDAPRSRVTP